MVRLSWDKNYFLIVWIENNIFINDENKFIIIKY